MCDTHKKRSQTQQKSIPFQADDDKLMKASSFSTWKHTINIETNTFDWGKMQKHPCTMRWVRVKELQVVKINPESLTTACVIMKSWFCHIKPQNLILSQYDFNILST